MGFEQSKKHGPEARQFVVLFDMAGFNVKQYTWRPGKQYPPSRHNAFDQIC